MNSINAVIFDFDGTLADGYPGIAAAVNQVRAYRGHHPISVHEVKEFVGRGLDHLLIHTVPGCEVQSDILLYRHHYQTTMYLGTTLYPGVAEAIGQLHESGYRMGVCSNKKGAFTKLLLRHLRIMPPIEQVFGPDDVDQPKPAPDMLLLAMDRMNLDPIRTLYVGDMDVDIQSARAAGMKVWVVPTGALNRESLAAHRPDLILNCMSELTIKMNIANQNIA